MFEQYKKAMTNYAGFSGRASRSEFWLYTLTYFLIIIAAGFVDGLLGLGGLLGVFVWLLHLVPSIAVAFRRLHDADRTAWWLLLYFLPVIGLIVLLVFYALKGTDGPNRYGPDPLETP